VNWNWVFAFIQTLSLLALLVYVVKTWQIAAATKETARVYEDIFAEMKSQREAEVAPYITAYFEIDRTSNSLFLKIKNIGKSVARNVRLQFNPTLKNTERTPHHSVPKVEDSPLIKNGIETMAPGYEVRLVLDRADRYIKEALNTDGYVPMTYYLTLIYTSDFGPRETTMKYTLDLNLYRGFLEF